jgi:hypothetical protein
VSAGNLNETLVCLGGPCCGITFRPPENQWSLEAHYDLDAPMENGGRAVGTYRVTWFGIGTGTGQRYSTRLVLFWIADPVKEDA